MDLLAHLRSFVAVCDEGHVTRAAAAVGRAQPVVSRQLKALEDRLGLSLFDRDGRRLAPTDAAAALLPAARDLLVQADRWLADSQAIRERTAPTVRLAIPFGCDSRALADAIGSAGEAGFALVPAEADAPERARRLAAGDCDLALIRSRPDGAAFIVALGLAAAPDGHEPHRSTAYLEELRPRAGRPSGPRMLIQPEDHGTVESLTRAALRAGVTPGQLEPVADGSGTAARILAGDDLLLCSRAEAYRHGLAWRRTPGLSARGYRLQVRTASAQSEALARLAENLAPVLRRALGGRIADRAQASGCASSMVAE